MSHAGIEPRTNYRQMWRLRDGQDVMPSNWVMSTARQVLLFYLPVERHSMAATHFGSFDERLAGSVNFRALFQWILHALDTVVQQLLNPSSDSRATTHGAPVELYIEPVLEAVNYRHEATDDEAQRKFVADYIAMLMKQPGFLDGSDDRFVDAELENMRFMRGMRNRIVIGWRFWFFVREPAANLPESMTGQIRKMFDYEMAKRASDVPIGENREHQQRLKRAGGNAQTAASTSMVVGDFDQYWHLSSLSELCDAVALYTEDLSIGPTGERRGDVMNPMLPYNSPDSELHPSKVFSVDAHFDRIAASQRVDPKQKAIANYRKSAPAAAAAPAAANGRGRGNNNQRLAKWVMPYPANVVRVPDGLHNILAIMSMHTPVYQMRHIEPMMAPQIIAQVAAGAARAAEIGDAPPDHDDDDEDDTHTFDGDKEPDAARIASSFRAFHRPGDAPPPARDEEEMNEDDAQVAQSVDEAERARKEAEERRRERDLCRQMEAMALGTKMEDSIQRKLERDLASGTIRMQETHKLRFRFFQGVRTQIDAMESGTDKCRALWRMAFEAVDAYSNSCMSAFSDVSERGRCLNNVVEKRKQANRLRFVDNYKFFDARFSFFGTQIVRKFLQYEELLDTHSAHVECHLVFTVIHGAYWYKLGLRNHLLFHGEHGTSKSFALKMAEYYCSPMSITTVSSESAHADDVDVNENDEVHFYHEVPLEKISGGSGSKRKGGSGGGEGTDKCDAMKTQMSEGCLMRRVCEVGEIGMPRRVRHVRSEKQKVFVLCTNSAARDLDRALKDRCICVYQVRRTRGDGETIASKQTDAAPSPEKKRRQEILKSDIELRQAIIYHLEKLIMIGAVHEPTLVAFTHIWSRYVETLKRKFGIELGPRQTEKTMALVRTHVVVHAVEWLYCSPTSPAYGLSFNIYHLLLLNHMLKDTAEIVFFCLDLMRDQFIDPLQKSVYSALREQLVPRLLEREFARSQAMYKRDKSDFSVPLGQLFGKQQSAALASRRDQNNDGRDRKPTSGQDNIHNSIGAQNRPNNNQSRAAPANVKLANAVGLMRQQVEELNNKSMSDVEAECDYNYIRLRMTAQELAKKVAAHNANAPGGRKTTPESVLDSIHSWKDSMISAHTYRRKKNDRYTPVEPDLTTSEESTEALKIDYDHNAEVLVHSSLVFGEFQDEHQVAIESCYNSKMVPAHYICGYARDPRLPYLLDVREVGPRPGVVLLRGGAALRGAAPDGHYLDGTYDELSTAARFELLALPCGDKGKRYSLFLPHTDRDTALEHANAMEEVPISYPEHYIAEARARLNAYQLAQQVAPKMTLADVDARVNAGFATSTNLFANAPRDDASENELDRQADKADAKRRAYERAVRNHPVNAAPALDCTRRLLDYIPAATAARDGILADPKAAERAAAAAKAAALEKVAVLEKQPPSLAKQLAIMQLEPTPAAPPVQSSEGGDDSSDHDEDEDFDHDDKLPEYKHRQALKKAAAAVHQHEEYVLGGDDEEDINADPGAVDEMSTDPDQTLQQMFVQPRFLRTLN